MDSELKGPLFRCFSDQVKEKGKTPVIWLIFFSSMETKATSSQLLCYLAN